MEDKVQAAFPGAITNGSLAEKVSNKLDSHGCGKDNTQLATSLCSDEVNRELDDEFRKMYGWNFSMGGLAGFPFGGITSFGAMAHHIPTGGSCLVIYGPHVGVDNEGAVGKINRRGRPGASGACCGSANAAAAYVQCVVAGEKEAAEAPTDPVDAQQSWVCSALLPHGKRVAAAENPAIELPHALFDSQDEIMMKIVNAACGEVAGEGKIALVGGLQINTPAGTPDYFMIKKFDILNNKGEVIESVAA